MTNISTRLALVALALCGAAATVQAADGAITRTISLQTGSFDSPSGWSQVWTSTESNPTITLTAGRKDMAKAANGTGMDLREGTAHSSTYTIAADGAWRVTGFNLTFRANSATSPTTVTSGAVTIVGKADEDCHLDISDLGEFQAAQFTLSGPNQGITTSDFTVTLEPVTPEEYITVDVDMTQGDFSTSTSGAWKYLWSNDKAAADVPTVYLSSANANTGATAANMQPAPEGNGFDLREGGSHAGVYTISTAGSWRVSGFELTFKGNDASAPVTVASGGQSLTSTAEEQTLVVENLAYGSLARFNLTGTNKGITTTKFKVRLSPCSPTKRGVSVFNYTGVLPYTTVYRIPTLAYVYAGTNKGRILAVNDFRPCGSDIGYGEVDLHMAYSSDLGLNWTKPFDPVDADGNHVADGDGQGTPATSNENRDCGFGDPSIVCDRETGELMMMGVTGRVPIGQATREIPQGLAIWFSHDGGDTWTPWADITEDILGQLDNNCEYGKVDGLFFTAGRMVQSRYVKVGSHYRVYVVGGGRSASIPDTQCFVFYTDDFGKNWKILGDPMHPALTTGGSEPKCEELPDGSVLFSGRAGGGRTFNVFTYTDYAKGEGSWDDAVFGKMVTGAASCNGDAMIVPVADKSGRKAYLLMQSIPLHSTSRVNVGVNYKFLEDGWEDFGSAEAIATGWDGSYQVSSMGSAYSSLVLLPDGTLGFIYEESTYGRDYCEIYRTLTIDEITSGQWSYDEDADRSTALELTRQLVAGKLAKAHADYPDRANRLEVLDYAAKCFNDEPSDESYLDFNRALHGVKTDTDVTVGIETVEAEEAAKPHRLFDLLGRKVNGAAAPGFYIDATARKAIRR